MASVTSEDEGSEENFSISSSKSNFSIAWMDSDACRSSTENSSASSTPKGPTRSSNVVINLVNRELYGRFAKGPKAKTERVFHNIHTNCRYPLSSLLKDYDSAFHIFMGFTLCGQYFLSYTEKQYNVTSQNLMSLFESSYEYDLHIWRFVPGHKLKYVSKHRIFNHLNGPYVLYRIKFMQFPNDMHKVVCYGYDHTNNPDLFHISIMTLPSPNSCIHCYGAFPSAEEFTHRGWCTKHGFMVHYMFSMTQPAPTFDPNISLSFPNHLVINTGHHIHILNVSTVEPYLSNNSWSSLMKEDDPKSNPPLSNTFFNDTFSEVSESASDHFGCGSVVDAILEDFIDPKIEPRKWIKKVVRRYSNGDFENSSLLSGQSRDEYNNPIEVPLLVQSLTDQHFDVVPEYKADNVTERQIIVTQRSMDCEQFVQRRAQVLCAQSNLQFMHCEDYDIKIVYVCPLNGEILCQAVIKIGALKAMEPNAIVENYWGHFLFTWNITTDAFDVIDSENKKLFSAKEQLAIAVDKYPRFNCNNVWVLSYDTSQESKTYLRDSQNVFEVCLTSNVGRNPQIFMFELSSSESDLEGAD